MRQVREIFWQQTSSLDTLRHKARAWNAACAAGEREMIPVEQRFWAKVRKTDGCWLWAGTCGNHGYGLLGVGGHCGRNVLAHRLGWELHYGIPSRRTMRAS